jgi:cobalt/nickel transport system permease protein
MSPAPTNAPSGAQRFPLSCDARLKLCIALLGWLCVLSATSPAAPLWIAACAWGSLLGLRVPLGRLLRPLGAGVFTALVALALRVALTEGGPELSVVWFGHAFALSQTGLAAAALLGARILGAMAVAAWLTTTTAWLELERALGWLRMPPALLEILSLARRYVSVLEESMDTARSAQTLRLGYRGWKRGVASAGVLMGFTLGHAFDQAVVTGQAMQLRGYAGARAPVPWRRSSPADGWLAAVSLSVFGVSWLLSRRFS